VKDSIPDLVLSIMTASTSLLEELRRRFDHHGAHRCQHSISPHGFLQTSRRRQMRESPSRIVREIAASRTVRRTRPDVACRPLPPPHWYAHRVRIAFLLVLASCTIDRPMPVVAPHHDPDGMSSAVLDRQDPAADTSHNPELSRSELHYVDPNDTSPIGCLRHVACNSGGGSDGILVVLAALAAVRRRRR
jgi:uncharacterized protein (TIGR03382 family)